jgi:hypothetical protein
MKAGLDSDLAMLIRRRHARGKTVHLAMTNSSNKQVPVLHCMGRDVKSWQHNWTNLIFSTRH